jgi:hypothetical protein
MNKVIYFIFIFTNILILSLLPGCSNSNDDSKASLANLKTFIDPESTLEWASFSYVDNTIFTHNEIMHYCDLLEAGGKSDWRMPSADETLDYVIRNTNTYEDTQGYSYVVSSQDNEFVNLLNPYQDQTYSTGWPSHIVSQEIPRTYYYDDSWRYYGYIMILNGEHEAARTYKTDETSALNNIYASQLNDTQGQTHSEFTCVRGNHIAAKMPLGTWVDVERQVEIIGTGQYARDLSVVDNRHIRLSTMMYDYSSSRLIVSRNAHFISSGIPDAQVKGIITSFAEATGATGATSAPASGMKASVNDVASIDVILGCLRSNEPEYCQKFTIEPATPEHPHNTYTQSTDDSLPSILYVTQDALGNYTLDEANPITIAAGEVTIFLTDSAGNTAAFTVEVVGEDTDVGVLNIPDISTLYNFKTTIDHGMDYIYHGYNDGESPFTYNKTLSICNVGSANISGTTFTIEVAPENTSLVRSFSHNYNGASVGFTAGSCENYNVSFEFFRPAEDTEVKFNITIVDNFHSLTWKDYTTFRLSQHPPVNVYLASSSQLLEGFLVAPGNQLVRVEFLPYDDPQKFLRVPDFPDNEYSLVLSTSSVAGEDTYMISTVNPPDRSKMSGFSDVTAHEPNDDIVNATIVPLLPGEITSYLHSGDLDFYILKYE